MIPGTLEAVTFTLNAVLSAWQTAASTREKRREALVDRLLRLNERNQAATTKARNFKEPVAEGTRKVTVKRKVFGFDFGYEKVEEGIISLNNSGFHITRRIIALIIVLVAFVGVTIGPVLMDASVAFGYPESVTGFFGGENTEVKWLVLGDAAKTVFIPPFVSISVSSVLGFFFGNQITK